MPITKDANLGPWKGFIKTDILFTKVFLNPVVLMVFSAYSKFWTFILKSLLQRLQVPSPLENQQ